MWQQQNERELSAEQIKRGLDALKELGVIEVVLSGGNPLLRKDIEEIIEYSSRYFITTVYDNGSMAASKIDALRHADFVAISIDSLNPKKNDYIRGVPGALRQAIKTVERLKDEGIQVGVAPTISQLNLNEIAALTNYFLAKKIPVWYSLYSYDPSEKPEQLFKIGKQNDEFMITDREAIVSLCHHLAKLKKKSGRIFVTDKILQAIETLYSENRRTWKCQALRNFLMIDNTGRVAGCHLHDPVASVEDLPRLWNSAKFDTLRRDYEKCSQCTYLCYIFYSLHGTILGNLQVAADRWRNATVLFRKKPGQASAVENLRQIRQKFLG